MRALVYVAPEKVELRHIPDPGLGEGEALLEVSAAGICGSDIHAFRISLPETPDAMAILGAGPIGTLALVLAKLRGVPQVCVIDQNEQRLAVARTLGADLVVNNAHEDPVPAVRSWTAGAGADC